MCSASNYHGSLSQVKATNSSTAHTLTTIPPFYQGQKTNFYRARASLIPLFSGSTSARLTDFSSILTDSTPLSISGVTFHLPRPMGKTHSSSCPVHSNTDLTFSKGPIIQGLVSPDISSYQTFLMLSPSTDQQLQYPNSSSGEKHTHTHTHPSMVRHQSSSAPERLKIFCFPFWGEEEEASSDFSS